MRNDKDRAAYWIAFILERCQFPNANALAAQFANAQIVELCECGCNSFALSMTTPDEVPRIATSGHGYGLVFEADFRDHSGSKGLRSLEILLFADYSGHLSYVEIDYCCNGLPIPERLNLESAPYNVSAVPRSSKRRSRLTSINTDSGPHVCTPARSAFGDDERRFRAEMRRSNVSGSPERRDGIVWRSSANCVHSSAPKAFVRCSSQARVTNPRSITIACPA